MAGEGQGYPCYQHDMMMISILCCFLRVLQFYGIKHSYLVEMICKQIYVVRRLYMWPIDGI